MSCHILNFYFKVLFMKRFDEITSRNELADFIGVKRKVLTHILYVEKEEARYKSFTIPKRNGGMRTIYAPNNELKYVQRKLAQALIEYMDYIREKENIKSNISHAFEKKKSIITNAEIHRNKKLVFNLDLKDFFDSFHFGRVCGYFQKNKFFLLNKEVATVIAQLVCYQGKLPQGAPTSPIITNLMCQILDYKILKLSKKYKVDYTRYADDLTFSTNRCSFVNEQQQFISDLETIMKQAGFQINHSKTRLQYNYSRQVVTGLVVNKKINVNRNFYKETKSMAHQLYKTGTFQINGLEATLNQLEGRFSFVNQIENYNHPFLEKHNFRNLSGRENEYRKFLFYKWFLSDDIPLIITEGKTDIIYLKAALKNLAEKYPNLIIGNADGKYEFKIKFLKRSKNLKNFFGVSIDGADALSNLLNYFTDNNSNNSPNCRRYFEKKYNVKLNKPILFLFDNELCNKTKPLYKFFNHANLKNQTERFKKLLFLEIPQNENLYVLTNPLVKDLSECEIEDLFDDKVLNQEINGKKFCRDLKNFDKSKHYSKDHFAKFIIHKYKDIDFSNFCPILDNINAIIESDN